MLFIFIMAHTESFLLGKTTTLTLKLLGLLKSETDSRIVELEIETNPKIRKKY